MDENVMILNDWTLLKKKKGLNDTVETDSNELESFGLVCEGHIGVKITIISSLMSRSKWIQLILVNLTVSRHAELGGGGQTKLL